LSTHTSEDLCGGHLKTIDGLMQHSLNPAGKLQVVFFVAMSYLSCEPIYFFLSLDIKSIMSPNVPSWLNILSLTCF
jgi:hypothetical protein